MTQVEPPSLNETNNEDVLPLLLTIPDVAARLRITRPTVYSLIYTKGLPYIKFGRCMRIQATSLQRWLDEREQQSA